MTTKDAVARLLADYDARCSLCEEYRQRLEALVRQLLSEAGMRVHSVTSRVKERPSIEKKLRDRAARAATLQDVTDVVGVRIITLFEDEVDKVGQLMESEFEVDKTASVDRRKLIEPDRFGYISLHYVVTLPSSRAALAEYRRFAAVKAEIQVRSVLQHAWAEIYHDLGYKSREGIPRDYERRFARIASMLEVADQQFVDLRDKLREYARDVSYRITTHPELVAIDRESVGAFVKVSPVVAQLDNKIAAGYGCGLEDATDHFLDSIVTAAKHHGMETIHDLDMSLRESGEAAVALFLATTPLQREKGDLEVDLPGDVPAGICVWWLGYQLALRRDASQAGLFDYMNRVVYADEHEAAEPGVFEEAIIEAFAALNPLTA